MTHFPQLVEYLKYNQKVSLIQLESQLSEINNELRFNYRATSGAVSIVNYGIKMAESFGLGPSVLASARRTIQLLEAAEGQAVEHSGIRNSLKKRKVIIQTAEKIEKIIASVGLDEEAKKVQLKQLTQDISKMNGV